MKRARIFLVDDHLLVGESIKRLLDPHHDIVGLATETIDLIRRIREVVPDILLLDISMPNQNGYEVAQKLQSEFSRLKIIFVSMHSEPTFIMDAFYAGGKGYVLKQTAEEELLSAITHVLDDQYYFSPSISDDVRNAIEAKLAGIMSSELSGRLTVRQKEVLKLLAQGLSLKEIATTLDITERTVVYHKEKIVESLGLKSKADLTRYAIMRGIR